MLNMAGIAEILKLFYLDGLRYQLNDKASAFLAQLERNSESVVGGEIRMALRYGRVGGIGNRPDDGTLPTPNSRKTKQAGWETKNIFARFQLTDKTIEASKSNVGAFASVLEQEIKDCETDAKLDLSRQALSDGTGIVAVVASGAHSAGVVTVTVDTTMYLAVGMLVDIGSVAELGGGTVPAAQAAVEITAVTSATTFTYAAAANPSLDANDRVVVAGNYGFELTGVDAVVNENTTLYKIDRSLPAWRWFNSNLISHNGEISETAIQAAIDRVEMNSGSEINFLMCSYGVRRAYQNLQTAMKQHVNTLEIKGGWQSLSYSGGKQPIGLVADKYIRPGRLYGFDLNDWKMYEMADWNWLDRGAGILTRVANKAAWEATLVRYMDAGCSRPSGQFRMGGITEH